MDYINFCQRLQQEIKTENLVSTALEMGLNLSREYEAKDVLLPQDTEQLMIIVKTANQYRVPLYPIGNGTRFAQGVKPFPEGIFVSLKKMNNCIEYRPNNMNIEVEAGITVSQIQKILAKDNIYFPIDSNDRSTIGGLIAANGYGRKKFLHKTTRFYVMGMEFVSPRGELIKVGGRTIKNVSSYDLHQLLAGSWGVFGIITKAILKVKPKPEKELVLETTAKDGTELLKVLERVLFSEKINLASLTFEQSHWGFPVRAELEGFAQTLQEQQEMLENEYGFRVPEGFFTTQSKENITIALPLKNYIKGLEKILELKQKKPQLNIRGNAGSGLIYLNFSGIESIIEKIKDIANTLEGDLVFEN
ncbi:MAG: FAD-binding oxidoreductase [Clostridia bacterium]|nr:FAD-binding oxidoreductase [Clostridia bacterium]